MLSHVEMAPAAGGFKLFGKVITQCAEGDAAAPAQGAPFFVAREEELAEEWPAASTPRPHGERERATIKREAAGHEEKQEQGGETESGGGQPPRRTQQQAAAEARAAAAAAEARAAAAAPLPCPRCRSRDTKFCYFNNYNVNQPRHFCKACHRYWTAGGALRNVPVGAGRRKNRPLGPVATVAGYQHRRAAAAGATGTGFVLGFPNPSSPTSPSPVYTDRWPVGSDRRF